MTYRKSRKGAALLISMIVLAILSAWAVSICSMSGTGVQLAENQRKVNSTRACAESGLGIVRCWSNPVSIPGTTAPEFRFDQIASSFRSAVSGISNITLDYDSSSITIPSVLLNSANGESFYASMTPKPTVADPNALQVDVTGAYRTITRTIRVNYNFGTREYTVFDYGVATKGPLHLSGNIELTGEKLTLDASVYIESENDTTLSIIGNSQIAGDVSITNSSPAADIVDLQGGQASIGGETVPEAYDHVFTGTPPAEFPVPDPSYFEHYVQNTYDPNELIFENIRIPPNTNPTFSGGATLKGIVFIEIPNEVRFQGGVTIMGIIIGNGDLNDNFGTNQIIFEGNVNSFPISALADDPNFAHMQDETGTFLMAPGFSVSFGGTFDILNGAIAANGIEFFGTAGGTIDGSVINYSDTPLELSGNSNLLFNRSGTDQMPPGFVPEIVLKYDPASYSEVLL